MCGIAGIIRPKEKDSIEKMTRVLLHRGPDDEGYFADSFVALGMRRLAIIDLARGKQPMTSADGRYTIFFNGEIYNYKELARELEKAGHTFATESDTEVVLRMFEVYDVEAFSHLRGMFALAIYDQEKRRLVIARDFFGIKPLYYWNKGDQFVAFSSEIKGFLKLEDFKAEVNDTAVYNYLSFQYNPLPETFFKNVFKLPPAHYMVIDVKAGKAYSKRYWQFEFKQANTLDEQETSDKILSVMKDSVKHHMIADVPVGSFLSGGIDSSIIVTLMQKHLEVELPSGSSTSKVKTFTVGFETLSEGKEARETAEPLGTDHREITIGADEYFKTLPEVVWHFDEPVGDPSALGLFFLAREAAKHVKVVLSGEGSDELFGGYNIYLEPFARKWISWIPDVILRFIVNLPFDFRGKNFAERALLKLEDRYIGNASIFREKELASLWKAKPEPKFSLENIYKEASNLSDSTKMQYVDIHTWLVGDILAKADKMTMAHSLELRVPFLDVKVAELALTLPDNLKWKSGVTKYILRKAFENILPESVRTRRKLGFPTPVRDWFTGDRANLYDLILKNPYIENHLDVSYIKNLIDDHLTKKADNSRKIYLLLMLAIWYNVFIENSKL